MPPSLSPASRAHGVSRTFDDVEALDGIVLELRRGEVTALVGANGAGKTTLLRILAGILKPDAGEVEVLGLVNPATASPRAARELRRRVGYLAQDPALDPEMTGREILTLMATLHGAGGAQRQALVEQSIEAFALAEAASRRVEGWSGGQRRRLHLAAGMVHAPELLLLDEPTAGLDQEGQERLWADLNRRKNQGAAVALVTHDVKAVEKHADTVAILEAGHLVRVGPPDDLGGELKALRKRTRNAEDSAPRAASFRPTSGPGGRAGGGAGRRSGRQIGGRSAGPKASEASSRGRTSARAPSSQADTSERRGRGSLLNTLDIAWHLCRRAWIKTLRRPVTLTFSLAQPLIWMGFFGFLFQRYRLTDLRGLSYLDFLAPGVCAMTVLFGASQSGVSWIRDLQTGLLPRLLNTPASPHALLAGKIAADVSRLLLQAAIVLLLALLLGAHLDPSPGAAAAGLLGLLLFATAFSSLSCAIALRTRAQEAMATFVHLVNMPVLFTSTALVPSRQMPTWLEGIARYNPLTLAVDAFRGALLFGEMPTFGTLLPLAVLAALLYTAAAREMRGVAGLY